MILEKETFEKFGYYPSDLPPHSHKKILVACDGCGKIRVIGKVDYRALCQSCANKGENNGNWKGGKVKRICEWCGKEFEVKHYKIKKGYGRFCSLSCATKKQFDGLKGNNWKKVKRVCEWCGGDFWVKPSRIKGGGGKYCSRKCMTEWQWENMKGENSPSWSGGKVKRICENCGKEFEVKPSVIKKGHGRFCSKSCARKKLKVPRHHTKPERIFEGICKKYNIPFHYVGDGQLWIGKKGGKQLNPDFIEANGKKICVEIFGDYWHSPLLNHTLREDRTFTYRKKFYTRYNWVPVFVWESDLNRNDTENFVLNLLSKKGIDIGQKKAEEFSLKEENE